MYNISIYHNLPSGGANNLYDLTIDYLTTKYKLRIYSENNKQILKRKINLISFIYDAITSSYVFAKRNYKSINKSNALIVFHSWLIKSPYILRFSQIPTIYICHEPPREFYDRNYQKSMSIKEKIINLIRLPIKYIDQLNVKSNKKLIIISNSIYASKLINQAYKKKSYVVYPGIKIEKIAHKKINDRENYVISVGSINKFKNQLHIARSIALINEKIRPGLILIGNGGDSKYIQQIKDYCNNYKVNLEIIINASSKQLRYCYNKSKIFAFASQGEPFGLVILEAMNYGLPIITSEHLGGFNEIISNKNGAILKNLNTLNWANKLEDMLSKTNELEKISKYNSNYVNNFNSEKMVKKIDQILARII